MPGTSRVASDGERLAVLYLLCTEELSARAANRSRHRMSAAPIRATSLPPGKRRGTGPGRAGVARYRAAAPPGKAGSKLREASEIPPATAGLDLATRLRVLHRALRGRIERRDALIDIVRAVNTTLEPAEIADLVVDRA